MSPRSLSRDEVRAIDRRAIQEYGLPGIVLMENAGRGTAELLMRLRIGGPVVIAAGRGNNGGDGFVIARHLENAGHDVRILLFGDPSRLQGDAAVNFRVIDKAGTPLSVLDRDLRPESLASELAKADWIVDALLGTGTQGEIREPYVTAIQAINAASARKLAVDLPSGLDCDAGEPLGPCVRANHTATFVARKRGFDNPGASTYTGNVHVIGIGVPKTLRDDAAGP